MKGCDRMASRKKKKKKEDKVFDILTVVFLIGLATKGIVYLIALIVTSEHTTLIITIIFAIMISFIVLYAKFAPEKKTNVNSMTGYEFEEWCAEMLKEKGFKRVKVTPKSGDYGADIVAIDKHDEKWVIQCKRQTKNVSNSAVQEVVAAKAHYKADKAAVMTNSQLTKKAKELAWENAVEIMEGLGNW